MPPDYQKELLSTIRASNDNAVFLKALDGRIRKRRAVSKKSGANFAPAVFVKMPEAKGVSKEWLEQAMDRLFRLETIARGPLWRDTERGRDISGLKRRDAQPQTLPPNDPQAQFPTDPKRQEINPQTHALLSRDNIEQASRSPAHDLDGNEPSKLCPTLSARASTSGQQIAGGSRCESVSWFVISNTHEKLLKR